MNEQIRLLAEQAGAIEAKTITNIPRALSLNGEEIEKFAQSIVQGCADIINYRADTCGNRLDSIKANEAVREAQRECAKTIKEHFGVESA